MKNTVGRPESISIYKLSELIEVGVTTLKTWESFFEIPLSRNESNARRYTQDNINTFQKIKKLSSDGISLKEVKSLLEQLPDDRPVIEILSNKEPELETTNFDLIIKPYSNRIIELEVQAKEVLQENKDLIRENATFAERIKSKEEIIDFQHAQIIKLEEKLSKKWWKFWG
jgi:DNA-binding transcriptional MerR regulator